MQRFLDLAHFEQEEILDLIELARRLEAEPEPHALAGKVLGLVFFNPSLRTLASFQSGMAQLGGTSFVITPGQGTWQLETRRGAVMNGAPAEHVREGVPVLAHYCDALGIRAFAGRKNFVSRAARVLWSRLDNFDVVLRRSRRTEALAMAARKKCAARDAVTQARGYFRGTKNRRGGDSLGVWWAPPAVQVVRHLRRMG